MSTHPAYRTEPGLPDWAAPLLAGRGDAILATVNRDGSPHTVPVGFTFEDDRFLIPSGARTRKVGNVERDPRARVLLVVASGVRGLDDGWVAADGSVEVIRGEDAQELNARSAGRYLTEEGLEGFGRVFLPIMDVTVVVTPWRWHSWNEDGMLATMAEHGYDPEEAARWCRPEA
jgi:PPOX class probable F420-dependent enzyme